MSFILLYIVHTLSFQNAMFSIMIGECHEEDAELREKVETVGISSCIH